MASSNIKLFDENKGNMLSDSEFSISNQRMNGLQTGVASSQLQNKAMYQASLVAYAIAQIMLQNGLNANDTDAVSAFVANLSGTMLQKVYDIATTAEAQAGVATGKWMSPALVKAAIDTLAAKAQNILSDETKTLLGLGTDSVPDNAFTSLKNLIDKNANAILANTALANTKAKFITGSYTGTGTNSATVTITFPSLPKILFVYSKVAVSGSQYSNFVVFPGYGGFGTNEARGDPAAYAVTISSSVQGNSIRLGGASRYDFNAAVEYGYIAIA